MGKREESSGGVSVLINAENIGKQYPSGLICSDMLVAKGLGDKEPNQRYYMLLNRYKSFFECFLKEQLSLDVIDQNMKESELGFRPVKEADQDFYQRTSGMGLTYIYLRNNIYVEKLTEEELYFLEEHAEYSTEVAEFVSETFERLVNPYEKALMIFYGPKNRKFLHNSDEIVLGIRYAEFDTDLEDETFIDIFLKKQIFISQLSLAVGLYGQQKLGKTVSLIQYNEVSIMQRYRTDAIFDRRRYPFAVYGAGKKGYFTKRAKRWGKRILNNSVFKRAVIPKGVAKEPEFVIKDGVLLQYNGKHRNVSIPKGIKKIGEKAFCKNWNLKSVVIPEGVTDIEYRAFDFCRNLKEIFFPESLLSIKQEAFYACENLVLVTIPPKVSHIGLGAFRACTKLDTVVLPNGIAEIAYQLFLECKSLKKIVLPQNIRCIEPQAFEDCESLTELTIPKSVTEIGWGAFSGCKRLKSIVIPKGVVTIESRLFYSCESLVAAEIPDGITGIKEYAFHNCKSLLSIQIPETVTDIEDSAFSGCESIKTLIIPQSVGRIGLAAFAHCKNLTSVTIPEGISEIKKELLYDCEQLTRFVVPDGVEIIGVRAFCQCRKLTSVVLPEGLRTIELSAFEGDEELRDVVFPESITKVGAFAFKGCGYLSLEQLPGLREEVCIPVYTKTVEQSERTIYYDPIQKKYWMQYFTGFGFWSAVKITEEMVIEFASPEDRENVMKTIKNYREE